MKRIPKPGELAKLKQLTSAREMAAMAKLAGIKAEKTRAEDQIAMLRAQSHEASCVEEMEVVEKWRVWKDQELRRLLEALARIEVAYRALAAEYGRYAAEDDVMGDILARSERKRAEDRQKQLSAFTSPDGQHQ